MAIALMDGLLSVRLRADVIEYHEAVPVGARLTLAEKDADLRDWNLAMKIACLMRGLRNAKGTRLCYVQHKGLEWASTKSSHIPTIRKKD